jgi:glycosyltransferase involved in cell wall biosynthesis
MSGEELRKKIEDSRNASSQVILLRSKARKISCIQQGLNFKKIRAVRRDQLDFIQISEYNEIEGIFLAAQAKKAGVPFVIYQGMYMDIPGRIQNIYQKIISRLALPFLRKNAEFVLAKTSWAADFIRGKGFPKVAVLPVGLDPSPLEGGVEFDWRSELGIHRTTPIVLYVGRLEARRSTSLLLELAKNFSAKRVAFVFAGAGDDFEQANKYIYSNQLRNVYMLGTVPQNKLRSLYETANCFVLPSSYEIYGMVLLEAMYYGLPVISSSTAGAEQVINHEVNGLIVKSLDCKSWESAINRLLSDKVFSGDISRMAKDKVRGSLLWDHVAIEYMKYIPDYLTNPSVSIG